MKFVSEYDNDGGDDDGSEPTGCPRNKSPLKFICGRVCASYMEIRITSREDNVCVYKP